MKRGTFLTAPLCLLSATLFSALLLTASALPADDGPLILPPPPAPAPSTAPVQSAPPIVVPPEGPRLDGVGSTTSTPAPSPIPLLPVPQVPGKPGTTPFPMNGPPLGEPPPPGGPLQNPEGSMDPSALNPVPEGGPAAANPGPPRLRMSEEKEKDKDKEAKAAEAEVAPIPASMVYRTRDILRPDLLRGKYYRLAEYAPLVDFNFRFEIETPWGTIPAQGLAMLDVRLRELCALEYGSRIAEKNPMFAEGFAQAICHTPQGAYILVTDPIGSVRRTGQAIKRMAVCKKSPGGCRGNCEARRRLACLIGCDPETRNVPLQCLLDDMTINSTGGWLAVNIGLNFGLPGLGFLPANAEFKKMMEHRSTREIQADLDASLIELGIPDASRTRFFNSPNYTTTQRMAFVFYLKMLIGIDNLACLVDGAADTRNEAEALASIRELQLIADLRHTRPLARVTFIGVPVLTLDDGSQIIVTVADYLVETPRTAQMIAAYRSTFATVPTRLATLGRVSAGAQEQFKAAGIDVIRHRLGQPEEAAAAKDAARTASAKPGATAPSAPAPNTSASSSSTTASGPALPAERS
jgi:hypothetical protein